APGVTVIVPPATDSCLGGSAVVVAPTPSPGCTTEPSWIEYRAPWHGQLIVPSLIAATRQPRWVQVALKARNCPAAGWVTTTPSGPRSGKIFPPSTGMSAAAIRTGPSDDGAAFGGVAWLDPPHPASVTATAAAPAPASTARRVPSS